MGRRSQKLMAQAGPSAGPEDRHVIQVVSRAFDILRCFENRNMRLGNRDIADRCGLPRSTVSRLMLTLTQIGQLIYLPQEQKYALAPHAIAPGACLLAESCDRPACAAEQDVHESASVHMAEDQLAL
jgi:DNA-binding IclR family transcriptional regulator